MATINKWIVVVTGRNHLDEFRKAPDDVLSFQEAIDDVCSRPSGIASLSLTVDVSQAIQTKYTLGSVLDDPYHIMTVKSSLTRNIASGFDVIIDEITESFKTYIPITERMKFPVRLADAHNKSEWTTVPAHETLMHIICRTSNRYFVGLPLCERPLTSGGKTVIL